MKFPKPIQTYLQTQLIDAARVYCLSLDTDNRVLDSWGDPAAHGLKNLDAGDDGRQSLPMLEDFGYAESVLLPFVSLAPSRSSHVHLFPGDGCRYALLLDARDEANTRRRYQQSNNELKLAYYRQSQLVDELVEARTELDTRRRGAEERSREQSEFIASLSHEVRTPLTSILGYAELLKQEAPSDAAAAIERGTRRLLDMVNELLQRARQEAVGKASRPAVTDLRRLLEELSEMIAPLAAEKGLGFSIQLEQGAPRLVLVDGLRLRQVLINLLGNAVKYTAAGNVQLTAQGGGGRLSFCVADTGPGIEAEDQQRIFAAFERVKDSDDKPGAGLGLNIVLQLVGRLKGEIELDSKPGLGTSFTVTIPAPEIVAEAVQRVRSRAANVLVVEDDPDIRALVVLQLTRAGFRPTPVESGEAAVRQVVEQPPDLVLMDLRLTGMSGAEAARQIRDDGYAGPVLALSASRDPAEVEGALAAGFSDYLFKPLDINELTAATERALATHDPTCS